MASSSTLLNLTAVLSANNTKFKSGLKGAQGYLSTFKKAVGGIAPALAGAFAIGNITRMGSEMVKLAAEGEGVRAAFNRIGNARLLKDLEDATKNTVSELELMKRAVQANNFQIPLESLAALLKFATKRAQETGESVDYLVNSIVLGIGRKSPLILDNLGISAVRLRQELKGAGVEMNTVADIAAAVGRIAASELEKAGDVIETTGVQIQQLKKDWEDLKETVGQSLISIYSYIRKGYKDLKDWKDYFDLADEANGLLQVGLSVESIARLYPDVAKFGGVWKEAADNIAKSDEELNKARETAAKVEKELYGSTIGTIFKGNFTNTFAPLKSFNILTKELVGSLGALYDIEAEINKVEAKRQSATEVQLPALNEEIKLLKEKADRLNTVTTASLRATAAFNEHKATTDIMSESYRVQGDLSYDVIGSIEKQIDAMAELDSAALKNAETIDAKAYVMKNAWKSVGKSIADISLSVGDSFARMAGQVAKGVTTFGEAMQALAGIVLEALGAILIMVGTKAVEGGQLEVGIPLILAGLAFKGLGSVVSNKKAEEQWTGYSFAGSSSRSTSTLYGNDIMTANQYATDLYGRVG